MLAGAAAVGEPAHVIGLQDPAAGDQTPVSLQVLLTLPVKPDEHAAVHTTPGAAPAQELGHPVVFAGAAVVGVPEHTAVERAQLPSTEDHPKLLQVVHTLPMKPVEQFALHTSPAAAGAQLAGQPAALAGVLLGLELQATDRQAPVAPDQAPLLVQLLLTLPSKPNGHVCLHTVPTAAPEQEEGHAQPSGSAGGRPAHEVAVAGDVGLLPTTVDAPPAAGGTN